MTRSALCTYIDVPDADELAMLDLQDVITEKFSESWQRLHITVQLQGTADQSACQYRVLVRDVDGNDRFTDTSEATILLQEQDMGF